MKKCFMCEREKDTIVFLKKFNICSECLTIQIEELKNWIYGYISGIKKDYPEEAGELYKQNPITLKDMIEWVEDCKKGVEEMKIIRKEHPELTSKEVLEVMKKSKSTKTPTEAEPQKPEVYKDDKEDLII